MSATAGASTKGSKGKAPEVRDMFAEMYVAGMFADAGWEIYFPRRDRGFDFVAIKDVKGVPVVRPVQVKGKYPEELKKATRYYGFTGKLKLHPDMVLAIAYFDRGLFIAPDCVAFLPTEVIKKGPKCKCHPAKYEDGRVMPRRDFKEYFGRGGIAKLG